MSDSSILTIFDIASKILQTNPATGKSTRYAKAVTDGLKPRKAKIRGEGLYVLEPEEILAIRVERLSTDGEVSGYQRPEKVAHARAIGRSLARGRNIARPTISLGEDGYLYATDGQHRLLGAVIARKPLGVVVEALAKEERIERFADQSLAIKPSVDVLVLALNDPISDYLRAAIEAEHSGAAHLLAGFVGQKADRKRLGAFTVYDFLSSYTLNVLGNTKGRLVSDFTEAEARRRISVEHLDEATTLLRAFGPKQTAYADWYAPATIRALRDLAVMAVRRNPVPSSAVERWLRLMPKFKWEIVPVAATRYIDRRYFLVKYWNRNLPRGFEKIGQ